MIVFSICGCAQTTEDTLVMESVTETESAEPQNTKAEKQKTSSEEALEETAAEEQELFTYIIDNDHAVVTGLQTEDASGLQERMVIPDTLGGYSVVEIGDHAFENTKLKNVRIPESVEVIGNSAFRNTNIEDVNFSQCYNLKEVKANAFENCNLHEPGHSQFTWFMEKIGERAFAGNKQLTRVNFWSGDVTIEKEAFDNCGDEMLFFVEWSREETGKEVETYAAANGITVEYPVTTQINVPSEPLLLTPEIGSFFYGELGGTYEDWDDDQYCSFEKTPDAPNFGFEDWQWLGCSRWCGIEYFDNQATASSELASASDRYCADNVVRENRELAWAEGAEGAGIGEYIVYNQTVCTQGLIESSGKSIIRWGFYCDDGYIDYTQLCIVNGYARDAKVWQENGRVKTLMMYVYDHPYARLELEDTINPQYFTIPQGDIRVANGEEVTFKFVIEEIYPGTMYEDTCITGIVADFGNASEGH
ncbi:MAG: leucine-rich repeat domain-containing protein [Acetatifactor sp.]|nr:leucine-rich repeat domain-containing protein [Acetatifactor sp.]